MRKPLQKRNETIETIKNSFASRQGHIVIPFTVNSGGEILFRNTGDIAFLIETANKFSHQSNLDELYFLPKFGNRLAVWMARFVSEGFTNKMLHELRTDLGNIRFFHVLNPAMPSRGRPLPHWDYVADSEDFADPKTMAAYAFSQQLTLDGFVGLKRCQMKSCQRFYIGRPNAKWCLETCGSLYRVRQKRKRDIE